MKNRLLKKLILLLTSACIFFCGCSVEENEELYPELSLGQVVVLGDSYSTFEGCVPSGNACWYYEDALYTNVKSAEDTWWGKLMKRTASKLLLNESYSGSTVCNTGYDGEDASSFSFVGRFLAVFEESEIDLTEADTVLIFGGLNDCWAGSPLGKTDCKNVTEQDLYSLFPAFSFLISQIQERLPQARVIVVLQDALTEEIKNGFAEICSQKNVELIPTTGISKINGHPDKKGMSKIASQIIDYLREENKENQHE